MRVARVRKSLKSKGFLRPADVAVADKQDFEHKKISSQYTFFLLRKGGFSRFSPDENRLLLFEQDPVYLKSNPSFLRYELRYLLTS